MYKRPQIFFFYFIILLFTYSCSKNGEEEYIEYSEIGLTDTLDSLINKKNTVKGDSITSLINSNALNLEIEEVYTVNTDDFTDRFGHINSEKFLIIVDKDSINFKSWKYKDSLSTMNSFYNLLDCFGPNCEIIDLFSNDYSEKKYNLILVSNHHIHWIQSKNNQSLMTWDKYLKIAYPTPSFQYIMQQRKSKHVEWLQRDNEKGKFITLNDNV